MSNGCGIGVQTNHVVYDDCPIEGFSVLKKAGFNCCDFSLNSYLENTNIYRGDLNRFFDKSVDELRDFFAPHKAAAKAIGIRINQMHMPYPLFVPGKDNVFNEYLRSQVMAKSLEICAFLECKYIVIHGLKLAAELGSEELEWQKTAEYLDECAIFAKEHGITLCIENLYDGIGGKLLEGPGCDAYKAARRIDEFNERYGAEVLGFCFDIGHANLIGLDIYEFVTILGDRLKVLHLHDNDGVTDQHQIPYSFTKTRENESATDWDGLMRGLADIDFKGVLSFETAPALTSYPETLKEDVLRLIARIGEDMSRKIDAIKSGRE